MRAAFTGSDAPDLAPFDPTGLADGSSELLDDASGGAPGDAGRRLVADRTWERAGHQLERCLRDAVSLATGESLGSGRT